MPKFKLFLKSINYTGRNIGYNLEFVIRVSEDTYKISLEDLRNRTKKEFDPLEMITEIDYNRNQTISNIPIYILVIERDPTKNDMGSSEYTHRIKIDKNNISEFSQLVELRERGGIHTKKNIASFEFTFIADFTINNNDQGTLNLPNLSPPVKWTKSTAYHQHSCDIVCIQKCNIWDWNCFLKCCDQTPTKV